MCGICGYVTKKTIDDDILIEMRDTISYRGPDDAGSWFGNLGGRHIGLAHRRLSIMDLSAQGHQPMVSHDGRYVIVYNGEIYNDEELRQELEKKGCKFRSTCDTETFLAAFQMWGVSCLNRINGMFAVAFWDTKEGVLTLARDRIGKKPLYYYFDRSTGDFVFASELKPIMRFPGFSKTIRKESISDFFCNKFIAAPNTIFEDTYKMIPGTFLTWADGRVHKERYWSLTEQKKDICRQLITDEREAEERLEDIISDSIRRRMIADVPVGVFLSGGIDSSLVTALAQKQSGDRIRTFSIGFYNKKDDEAPFAREIADHIGTEHTELYISDDELFRLVDKVSQCYDEPMSDSSQIPSMAVCSLAAKDVKVVLTGDGGDELFCGYKMYDWMYWTQMLDGFGAIASLVPGLSSNKLLPVEARAFIKNRDPERKAQLFADVRIDAVKGILSDGIVGDVRFPQEKKLRYKNWQERRMVLDMLTYLPDEILCKMDRASMYYSLEARSPILDHRVAELSFCIPQRMKYKNFDKKHILKSVTYKHVPERLLDRPKRGFSPPIRSWLRGPLHEKLLEYADGETLKRQGIFSKKGVDELIAIQQKNDRVSYSTTLWSFYVFQEWYKTYID